jgi:hypothetical protein
VPPAQAVGGAAGTRGVGGGGGGAPALVWTFSFWG